MNKFVKQGLAIALALAAVSAGAESCKAPGNDPKGLITDISRPPLAQTLGCGDKLWRLSILNQDIANDPKLTPDQKAAKSQKLCVTEAVAKKYVLGGQYP